MSAYNKINTVQDAPEQIKLLRARTQTYSSATMLLGLLLVMNVGVPVLGGLSAFLWTGGKAYVATFALIAVVLDALLIDRRQKLLIRRAATIGEMFDTKVLEMPWDEFTVGDRTEAEEVHRAASAYERRHSDELLKGWYPRAVSQVPLHLARLICQRTNLRYDSELRKSFGAVLLWSSCAVMILFLFLGLILNATLTDWVLTLALVTPFLSWASREYYRQIDAAYAQDKLRAEARKLWDLALYGQMDANVALLKSRELQSAIFLRRATTPLIIPFLYQFQRPKLESEMNQGAEDFVTEYKRSRK